MRYAILSDIHGNLPALEAVLADLSSQAVDALFFLGDAIGYGPDGNPVLRLLRKHVSHLLCRINGKESEHQIWLVGNHEEGLLGRSARSNFNDDALITLDKTNTELEHDLRQHLQHLPNRIELILDHHIHATLVHAAPSKPVWGYIHNENQAAEEGRHFDTQICIVGHTHYPRIFRQTNGHIGSHRMWEQTDAWEGEYSFGYERLILNPGSVGQPRDGDPRAAYAILDTHQRTFTVRRVTYDIPTTQTRIRAWVGQQLANLDNDDGLAGRLRLGI